MTIFCFIVAILASFIGFMFLTTSIGKEEWAGIEIGAAFALIAVFGWIGFAHFNHLDNMTWHRGDSVVYATMTTDDTTFVITSQGTLLHCEVASQCTGLVKGDHVTYQELNDGKVTLPDGHTRVHDIKDVVKG
jgi:hypothetical protein